MNGLNLWPWPLLFVVMLSASPGAEGGSAISQIPEQVALAGTWKGLMTGPLPPAKSNATCHQDKGLTPAGALAMAPSTPDQEWQDYRVPTPWSRYGGDWAKSDGEAVFRRRFSVPESWLGHPLELHLGAIDDFDLTQVNGITVGSTDIRQPGSWAMKRVYRIPAGLLHAGDNLLCVRVFDNFGEGGLMGPKEDLYVCPVPGVVQRTEASGEPAQVAVDVSAPGVGAAAASVKVPPGP